MNDCKVANIGDRVLASMNGQDWFSGVYEENIDLFAQYGVRLDDGVVKYFIQIEPMETGKIKRI